MAGLELLRAVTLTGELARNDDEATLRPRFHDPPHGRVAGPTEMPSALEGVRELLGHDLRIQGRSSDFLDLDLRVVEFELPLYGFREALDRPAFPADHKARSLGEQGDPRPHRRPLDVEATEPCATGLIHQVFLEQDPTHVLDDDPLVFALDFLLRHLCHLFQYDLEVHAVLVPLTAPSIGSRPISFRRGSLVRVDHADHHRVRILLSRELRVRDRALQDLEECLRGLHRVPSRSRPGLVGDPAVVRPHGHGLLQGDDAFEVLACTLHRLAAQLARELDGFLPCEGQVPAIGPGHCLDLVFHRVPELCHSHPHLSGMNFDDRVAPTPGPLCVTAFRVIANSPMKCPIISGLISTVTNSFPLWIATFLPMKSGRIGTSRQCVRTASSVPFARTFSTKVRRSSSMPRMNERRGRAGKSSMISSRVIAFISSSVYPRYVNSFLRLVSTRPARFRSLRLAAFASPPICFFAIVRTSVASPSAVSASGTSGRPSDREERHSRPSAVSRRAGGTRRRAGGPRRSSRRRGRGTRPC